MVATVTKTEIDEWKVEEPNSLQRPSAFSLSALKKIGFTIVLAIAALFVCELVARFVVYLGKPASAENPQYHMKYLVASKLFKQHDNIILCGDSLMKNGLYPELMSAKLKSINPKIRVINLAVNGGTQQDAIIYLDYLEQRGIKPRCVVFDYEVTNTGTNKAAFTAVGVNNAPAHKVEDKTSRGYLFDGLLQRPKDFIGSLDVAFSDFFYLNRHRGHLKQFILEFLRAIQYPIRFERKAFFELNDTSDIGTTDAGMSPNHRLLPEEDRLSQKKAIWTFHPTSPQTAGYAYNAKAYDPIMDYCQQHKIPLVLVWLPHLSSIYREFYYQAPYTEDFFRQQFESYARRPYVHPIYLNKLEEDYNYYTDYRHLSTYGCVKASELFSATLLEPRYSELIQQSSSSSTSNCDDRKTRSH